jgi:diguanylate cyclase (GGDEF)-like protein/PAS domain S-box-containing protein
LSLPHEESGFVNTDSSFGSAIEDPVISSGADEDRSVFRTLLDKMSDGVFIAQDYRFVFANTALPRMLGYTHEEFVGLGFETVIAPEFLDLWNERFRMRTGEGEEPANTYELRFLHKGDRRAVPIELNANRIMFGGKRGVLGIVRDITRRKRNEVALLQSEQRFRGTFEQAAVGMAMVGLDGRWLSVNPKLCATLGDTAEELQRRTFQDITHPDDLATDLDSVSRVLSGEQSTYSMEKRYLHKDGTYAWARLTVSLMRDIDGTPSHFISVVEDIHERRMAQGALADSELRYRLLMHNLHAGILICSPDVRILYSNPEASRMLGMGADAMVGQPVARLGSTFTDESGAPLSAENDLVRRILFSGRAMSDLVIGIHHPEKAEPIWVLVHAYPEFDTSRRLSQVVVLFIDITDRRRLEAEIRADRQLKATALNAMTSHVAVIDKRGVILETNASWQNFARRNGYVGDVSFVGLNYLDILSRTDGDGAVTAHMACEGILSVMLGRSPLFQMDYACHAPNEQQWFALKVTAMDPECQRILVSHENVTLIKQAEEAIRTLANTDALTALSNRRHFLETAEEEFARAQRYDTPLAVLMADLDFFKSINDRYGHAGGDEVLKNFAAVLSGLLRDSDSAGRIGGEEFAVLLPHTTLEGARAFAERLMECIAAAPPEIDGAPAPYTLSIGVSELAPCHTDFAALLRNADHALYRAKHNGRNRFEVLIEQEGGSAAA